ncbi:MAG TPA: hypothetical protein VK477_07320, partial [Acidobacteriota bacterium]|nr:hypothetical protein [Acidobacteriota bacterium]
MQREPQRAGEPDLIGQSTRWNALIPTRSKTPAANQSSERVEVNTLHLRERLPFYRDAAATSFSSPGKNGNSTAAAVGCSACFNSVRARSDSSTLS